MAAAEELSAANKKIVALQTELREAKRAIGGEAQVCRWSVFVFTLRGGVMTSGALVPASVVAQDDIMKERLAAKESELKALKEQVVLLKESVKSTQQLLAAKGAEKEECEYQWATTKGQLAKSESDYMMLVVRARDWWLTGRGQLCVPSTNLMSILRSADLSK